MRGAAREPVGGTWQRRRAPLLGGGGRAQDKRGLLRSVSSRGQPCATFQEPKLAGRCGTKWPGVSSPHPAHTPAQPSLAPPPHILRRVEALGGSGGPHDPHDGRAVCRGHRARRQAGAHAAVNSERMRGSAHGDAGGASGSPGLSSSRHLSALALRSLGPTAWHGGAAVAPAAASESTTPADAGAGQPPPSFSSHTPVPFVASSVLTLAPVLTSSAPLQQSSFEN